MACSGSFNAAPVTGMGVLEREMEANACITKVVCMLELSALSSEAHLSPLSSGVLVGEVGNVG